MKKVAKQFMKYMETLEYWYIIIEGKFSMPATALIAAAGILTFTNPALQCIVRNRDCNW